MSTSQPIRDTQDLTALREFYLKDEPNMRNYVLICLGVNSALRISDLLELKWKDVYNFKDENFKKHLIAYEKKTGKETWIAINENARNSKSSVSCESLMLDDISRSDTIPVNDIRTDDVEFSHEAKIGKISDQSIFYLMSRGLSEEDAKAMIVRGFADPISKELPIEYAVEMNNLINLELDGAIG